MKLLKSNHKLVGQNEQIVKKSHKHDTNLRNNSTLYFQVGLILTLLASYGLLEMNFESESFKFVSPYQMIQKLFILLILFLNLFLNL